MDCGRHPYVRVAESVAGSASSSISGQTWPMPPFCLQQVDHGAAGDRLLPTGVFQFTFMNGIGYRSCELVGVLSVGKHWPAILRQPIAALETAIKRSRMR